MDRAARRVGRLARDFRRRQRLAVADCNMRAERNRNEMIGNGPIEIVFIGETFILEPEILHRASMRDDPTSLRNFRGSLAEPLQNIRNRVNIRVKVAAVDELHLGRAFL